MSFGAKDETYFYGDDDDDDGDSAYCLYDDENHKGRLSCSNMDDNHSVDIRTPFQAVATKFHYNLFSINQQSIIC